MLTAFLTLVSFGEFKTANFRLSCFKIKFYFLLYPTVATRKLQPKKHSRETAEENVKQRKLDVISIATRKKFCLVEISGAKIKPGSTDEELCN